MKSLSTLIKLQKMRVDDQRIMLMRVQDKLDHIEQTILAHEQLKTREQETARQSPENAVTYGEFVKRAIKHTKALERERQIAVAAVNAAHNKLSEMFEEQKRYEIAEAARIAAAEREELRRETAELDEIGAMTHERRKGQ